jgi:hypothetical protein
MSKKHKSVRQDSLAMILTALFGVITGGYLYVVGFAPQFDELVGNTEVVYDDFMVIGEKFSSDTTTVGPSFQLLNDRSFRYIMGDDTTTAEPKEGYLPIKLYRDLTDTLQSTNVDALSSARETENCLVDRGGVDYVYDVTVAGTQYTFDTCLTNFSPSTDIGKALGALWTYFESLE